jgi:Cu+-exporting ATPase
VLRRRWRIWAAITTSSSQAKEKHMNRTLSIEGMSCQHCVMRVKNALEQLEGVRSAAVDLENKKADVELEQELDEGQLTAAVREAGYTVSSVY